MNLGAPVRWLMKGGSVGIMDKEIIPTGERDRTLKASVSTAPGTSCWKVCSKSAP